jgi:hypothetical protein
MPIVPQSPSEYSRISAKSASSYWEGARIVTLNFRSVVLVPEMKTTIGRACSKGFLDIERNIVDTIYQIVLSVALEDELSTASLIRHDSELYSLWVGDTYWTATRPSVVLITKPAPSGKQRMTLVCWCRGDSLFS